ncbi:hypothetical protein ACFV4M_10595 [Kitasatospora indigofera]|uniref:hypothetical protein n=1 Tax=Kitasatospora indigofera TaxID=67307 RepID=UPI00363C0959
MNTHLALIATPLVLGVLVRLLRRPRRATADLARGLRDLITLRMVLRDTDPDQRARLLRAHHAWRTESAGRPRGVSRPPARSRR